MRPGHVRFCAILKLVKFLCEEALVYMNLKQYLKRFIPDLVFSLYRARRLAALRARSARLPVKDVFRAIYEGNAWGGEKGQFVSGYGSSETHAHQYAEWVRKFIAENNISSIVDFGCGDFRVGSKLLSAKTKYVGVDIVDELVDRNRLRYSGENVSFVALDIISDDLPDADLCLIRQVLQHLSNAEIMSILKKIRKYPYVIVTEHHPALTGNVIPNKDKPHGADIRVYDNSAVALDKPPFNVKNIRVIREEPVLDPIVQNGERLVSYLIQNGQDND